MRLADVYGWADSRSRQPMWARMAAMGPYGVGTNLGGHPLTPCQSQTVMAPAPACERWANLGSDNRESTLVDAQKNESR